MCDLLVRHEESNLKYLCLSNHGDKKPVIDIYDIILELIDLNESLPIQTLVLCSWTVQLSDVMLEYGSTKDSYWFSRAVPKLNKVVLECCSLYDNVIFIPNVQWLYIYKGIMDLVTHTGNTIPNIMTEDLDHRLGEDHDRGDLPITKGDYVLFSRKNVIHVLDDVDYLENVQTHLTIGDDPVGGSEDNRALELIKNCGDSGLNIERLMVYKKGFEYEKGYINATSTIHNKNVYRTCNNLPFILKCQNELSFCDKLGYYDSIFADDTIIEIVDGKSVYEVQLPMRIDSNDRFVHVERGELSLRLYLIKKKQDEDKIQITIIRSIEENYVKNFYDHVGDESDDMYDRVTADKIKHCTLYDFVSDGIGKNYSSSIFYLK